MLWRNRSVLQHAVIISCSSFCTNVHSIPLALPQPRLRRTKSNQCSWSKFAAVQGLYFCWHGKEAVTAEGLRDTQLASLNRTCNSCFCFVLSNYWGHLYPAAVNFSTTWHERLGENVREDFFFLVYIWVRWPSCDGRKALVNCVTLKQYIFNAMLFLMCILALI